MTCQQPAPRERSPGTPRRSVVFRTQKEATLDDHSPHRVAQRDEAHRAQWRLTGPPTHHPLARAGRGRRAALRRLPGWRGIGNGLLLAGPLTLALVALYFLTFSPTVAGAETGIAGLTERILVLEMQAWYVALGWLVFRRA
jgi:hypothetical protein